MSIFSRLRKRAADRRQTYDIRRTRLILEGLPPDVQKDIGYPAEFERNRLRLRTGLPL
ncbi:MAG: hypothetical protein K8H74_02710 [Notoacmeibacter sp.]|nr:hypothetical protein [Notoacmeibacter sp.]